MARTMVVRRAAAVTFALVGLAGAFIAGTGSAAVANQGDVMVSGQQNDESFPTVVINDGTSNFGDGIEVLPPKNPAPLASPAPALWASSAQVAPWGYRARASPESSASPKEMGTG